MRCAVRCRSIARPHARGSTGRTPGRGCRHVQRSLRPVHRGCLFDDVFVPWARVFLAGEWQYPSAFTYELPRTTGIPASRRAPVLAIC